MSAATASDRPLSGARLPLLVLLFAGSGAAALIYEIVWFQRLELFIGSSAISAGVLLATFMGGMGAGALLFARVVSIRRAPLRVYAALELAIGAAGLLLLAVMPVVGRVYEAWGGAGAAGFLLRALAAAICLLPPTLAMGAALPAIARSLETNERGIAWLGALYAGNIAGGVCGALVAGFYLLRLYDVVTATCVAAGLNALLALAAFALAPWFPPAHGAAEREGAGRTPAAASGAVVYVAIGISGFCALAGEVVWTRVLGLLFAATVYTFSIVLAVFLSGLGLGSAAGAILSRLVARPRLALGWCQILLVGAIAWTAYMLFDALPYWPIVTSASPDIRYTFELDVACAAWALLPAPFLWGASVPLALASVGSAERDAGRLVARVYAANTLGAIAGSLAASLLLVAWLGTQHTQQVMMILSGYAGALLLLTPSAAATHARGVMRFGAVAALVAVAAGLLLTVPPIPGVLVTYGKYSVSWAGHLGEVLYVGEGLNASVAVSRTPAGVLNYHSAGKIQASSEPQDMRLQRMLGHLTTLMAVRPAAALVIGCGTGITAGAVSLDPAVARETVVELERLVPDIAATYFGDQNFGVVHNPKVRIEIDDARHYLLTTPDTFDVITADPFDPWVRGAAMLYTREFFEAVKAHLNPGGLTTLWVPLYTTTPEAVKSQMATFFTVFPDALVFGNTHAGKGYDTVLVGRREAAPIDPIDVEETARRLQQPAYAPVEQSLSSVGLRSAVELYATYAGRARDLQPWVAGAAINTDTNLRLQYVAGLGLDFDRPDLIYRSMLQYRAYPQDLFAGSPATLAALRAAIESGTPSKP